MLYVLLLFFTISDCFGGKYDYGLFENFVLNEDLFRKELKAVNELKDLRNALMRQNSTGHINDTVVNQIKNRLRKLAQHFASQDDFEGAHKGLLVLIDTYEISAEDLLKGSIGPSIPHDVKGLQPNDLIDLARTAFEIGWMDNAAKILKTVLKLPWKSNGTHESVLNTLRKHIPKVHNELLRTKRRIAGEGFKILPYMIDDNMERKKKQPRFVRETSFLVRDTNDMDEYKDGDQKENSFRRICAGKIVGRNVSLQGPQQCFLLHHHDPYLRLGPFKMEVILQEPVRLIFRDILTENEINWLMEYSRPRLSRKRVEGKIEKLSNAELVEGKATRTIHKTVQCWISERVYNEKEDSGTLVRPNLFRLSTKIGLATGMKVTGRWSSTDHQVTNYGLGGLCETHIDASGYSEGKTPNQNQKSLPMTGDIFGTFMAWLENVPAGGKTAFDRVEYEQALEPSRGSAAFWISLDAKGHRDRRSTHGGCPVLLGSKWILNKWIFFFDQFREWKCGLKQTDTFKVFKSVY